MCSPTIITIYNVLMVSVYNFRAFCRGDTHTSAKNASPQPNSHVETPIMCICLIRLNSK